MTKKSPFVIFKNLKQFVLSENELKKLVKTRQNFLDWKTTARSWEEIEKDLEQLYKQS